MRLTNAKFGPLAYAEIQEERYGLSSDKFYRRFQAGQTDDRMDYVEWASLVQMQENLQQRLRN